MTLLTLILFLIVIAVVIYGVKLAFAGDWKNLIILAVVVVLAIWLLGAFGITLPTLPTLK